MWIGKPAEGNRNGVAWTDMLLNDREKEKNHSLDPEIKTQIESWKFHPTGGREGPEEK